MGKPKAPPLVDPHIILNPAWRKYFGKVGDGLTIYHLLIRHIYNINYYKEIRERTATSYEKDKTKRPPEPKKNLKLTEWRKNFHAAIWDKVKHSKMFSLRNVPPMGEDPQDTIIVPTAIGKAAILRIKEDREINYMKRVVALLEENMNDLFDKYQKEQEGNV